MPEGAVRLEMDKSLWNVMQLYTLVNSSLNSCLKFLIMHDSKLFVYITKDRVSGSHYGGCFEVRRNF